MTTESLAQEIDKFNKDSYIECTTDNHLGKER
jgi:hypothetical protein